MVFMWVVPSHLNRSSETLAQNSFPWSVMRSMGVPNLQIQWLKKVADTVAAFFVAQSHQLDILGEGVCGAEKELLSVL